MYFYVIGFTDLSLNDQMRLLQSTWAELLTLTMAFRSLKPFDDPDGGDGSGDIGSVDKESSSGLKLRYATDYWLDERLARECSSPNGSNGMNGTSTTATTTSSTTNGTFVCGTTPTVLDIYNLVSIISKHIKNRNMMVLVLTNFKGCKCIQYYTLNINFFTIEMK